MGDESDPGDSTPGGSTPVDDESDPGSVDEESPEDQPDAEDRPDSEDQPDAEDRPDSEDQPDAEDRPHAEDQPDAEDRPDSEDQPDADGYGIASELGVGPSADDAEADDAEADDAEADDDSEDAPEADASGDAPDDADDGDPENEDADGEGVDDEGDADDDVDDDDVDGEDSDDPEDGVVTDGAYSTEYDLPEGPAEDEEMPLTDHIEEMIRRLAIIVTVVAVVTVAAYPASEWLIEFLWQSYVPSADANRPVVYGPLEFILTKIQVAALSGFVVGLPVFVYQTYLFMKPGLYPNERRYYLASIPTSLVLALLGVTFAHFVVLPLTFLYFTSYTEIAAVVAYGLRETFNLIILLMGYMALVFQIPLFMMLAIMMNLVSREWMEDKRLLFWAAFAGLSFTFVAVDPTGMAPIIIALTMIALFEITLVLLRWTGN